MQDRFKFRFFETYNNTMLDCKDYDFNEILENGKPVMQCTGLKDKNGKLIYEGDIISFNCTYRNKITNYKFAIVFFNGCFGVFTEINFEPLTQFLDYHCENGKIVYDDCYAEVIGNIYENPELLED